MAHHVLLGQLADADALHALQDLHGVLQAAGLVPRQVDLGDVAGDDHFGAEAHAGQEHFHLFPAGVLGLVENDKAVIQRPATHIGQRGHLDVATLQIFLVRLRPQHIEQGVV